MGWEGRPSHPELARLHLPYVQNLIGASRQQQAPVGRESKRPRDGHVTVQRLNASAAVQVPNADRVVVT